VRWRCGFCLSDLSCTFLRKFPSYYEEDIINDIMAVWSIGANSLLEELKSIQATDLFDDANVVTKAKIIQNDMKIARNMF
jgi:hypothetical protein